MPHAVSDRSMEMLRAQEVITFSVFFMKILILSFLILLVPKKILQYDIKDCQEKTLDRYKKLL